MRREVSGQTHNLTAVEIPRFGAPKAGALKLPGQDTDWTPVLITRGVYRNYAYARKELENLVDQFLAVAISKVLQE